MNSTCDAMQASVSARFDGEPEPIESALLDAHLAHCPDCAHFAAGLDDLHRRARVAAAPAVTGMGPDIARAAATEDRRGSSFIARWLLAFVAAQIIVLSVPDLLATDVHRDVAHAARHLGAFSVAYAAGLLVVVARPARARTMLHVAMVLVAALAITGLVDVGQGRAPLIGEAAHLPELLSVLLLWLLARPLSGRRRTGAGSRSSAPVRGLDLNTRR